ncbi:hypothetical protein X975_15816, partial [Stegodyphus mimosarum]
MKQFQHEVHLEQHLCIHIGEKPFKCESCLENFKHKEAL